MLGWSLLFGLLMLILITASTDSPYGFVWGIIVFLFIGVGGANAKVQENRQKYESTKKAYQKHLDKLKLSPEDNKLYDSTFEAGRAYVDLARLRAGERTPEFTEAMLSNDLAHARQEVEREPKATQQRLAELDSLMAEDLITQDEYKRLRQQILDSI